MTKLKLPTEHRQVHLNARENGKCNPPVAQEKEEMTLVSSWQSPPHLLITLLQPLISGLPNITSFTDRSLQSLLTLN